MTGPSAARPARQEAREVPRGNSKPNPNYVCVVNPEWNSGKKATIKRKDAGHYAKKKRGEFVGPDEFRLIETHLKNIAAHEENITAAARAAARGAEGYDRADSGSVFGLPRTWLGRHDPGRGAPARYAHNNRVCNAWRPAGTVAKEAPCQS